MKEKIDVEQTNVKVLEELLKGFYYDYMTKCGEVEESKRTIQDLQKDKRTVLAAKEATEVALYGYQEAMEENDNLMNKNKELLRKVSILECKMEDETELSNIKNECDMIALERDKLKVKNEESVESFRKQKEVNLNMYKDFKEVVQENSRLEETLLHMRCRSKYKSRGEW